MPLGLDIRYCDQCGEPLDDEPVCTDWLEGMTPDEIGDEELNWDRFTICSSCYEKRFAPRQG